ncbi:MAG: sensor domain-containing diguanylate cyclase [Dehalococcoidia bacterium]
MRRLAELATLASSPLPPEEAIRASLPLVQEGLGAADVHLVYGWDDGFRWLSTGSNLELSDIALWLVQRDLTPRGRPAAFDVRDGKVVEFRDAGSRRPCEFVTALLPLETTSDMLIAQGTWPQGLTVTQTRFLQICLPPLGLLVQRWLDSIRAERQRHQLSALASIPQVLSESDNLDTVLTGIASTIATVSGVNYVSIDVVDQDGNISFRSINGTDRPGTASLSDRWKQGATRPDPVRDAVIRTRKPMVFADCQNDERLSEAARAYFSRTLIRSTALLPLLAKDEVLGVLGVASHRPIEFSPAELELLSALGAQVATAVKGIRLYQELASSREELREVNDQLRETMGIEHHLARTDALTGIPNRRFTDETIEAEYIRAQRYQTPLSVVMADLDNLKAINDTYSHHAGDAVLQFVANLARESCREVDVVGRYGGDEFLFILPSTDLQDAAAFAERFRERLASEAAPNCDGAPPLHLTASLGAAQWSSGSPEGPTFLIRQADRAMYRAKVTGRNRTVLAGAKGVQAA